MKLKQVGKLEQIKLIFFLKKEIIFGLVNTSKSGVKLSTFLIHSVVSTYEKLSKV